MSFRQKDSSSHMEAITFDSFQPDSSFTLKQSLSSQNGNSRIPSDDLSTGRSSRGHSDSFKNRVLNKLLSRTCLHPRLSLRQQLLLSFGSVSAFSLLLITTVSIYLVKNAGEKVKYESRNIMERTTEEKISRASKIMAETITANLEHLKGLPGLLVETTKDRFIGYPDYPGYEDDTLVPFFDVISGQNKYPLKATSLLPLDWEFKETIITDDNAEEHLNGRKDWFTEEEFVGTSSATIRFQGSCDPRVKDPNSKGYFPNCTKEHNNHLNGGIFHRTSTYNSIYLKASDYATAVLKPLFEAHELVKAVGIYFANHGAGASVEYPALPADGSGYYTSAGCDWLSEPNPLNKSRSIGSPEMVNRCRSSGEDVAIPLYNPLERDWCREQALDPSKVHIYGPYEDAFTEYLLITIGQAVYDRITHEFIACTLADVSVEDMAREIENFKITNSSEISLVKWADATLVASAKWNATKKVTLVDLEPELDQRLFKEMREQITSSLNNSQNGTFLNTVFKSNDKAYACYPVPLPPKIYDPEYLPEFVVIIGLDLLDAFQEVNGLDTAIDTDINEMTRNILIAGFICFAIVILSIILFSLYLTLPIHWMSKVGDDILRNVGAVNKINLESRNDWLRFSPRTEISYLVRLFTHMIKKFSGVGTASLQSYKGMEMKNPFMLQEVFETLYRKRAEEGFKFKYEFDEVSESHLHENYRIHWGSILHSSEGDMMTIDSIYFEDNHLGGIRIFTSPLFWCILITIALPLILTLIAIATFVILGISHRFPHLIRRVVDSFITLEVNSLLPLVKVRANYVTKMIAPSIRDSHLLSRITGWLYFGELQMAKTLTSMDTARAICNFDAEKEESSCFIVLNHSSNVCTCSSKFEVEQTDVSFCFELNESNRGKEKLWWVLKNESQLQDYYAKLTSKNNLTDFDMVQLKELQVSSALSMIQIPLFNHHEAKKSRTAHTHAFFERSGILSGFTGCDNPYDESTFIISEFKTNSHESQCTPKEDVFEPLCNTFYTTAKEIHLNSNNSLYLSPPHFLDSIGNFGQTIILPIQGNDEYVGQASLEFSLARLLETLEEDENPLSGYDFFTLLPKNLHGPGDSFLAPVHKIHGNLHDEEEHSIEEFVLPFDRCEIGSEESCSNLDKFQHIVERMHSGDSESITFQRMSKVGKVESVFWAYAPITLNILSILNHSDISRGVRSTESTIFTLALASPESDLRGAFATVKEDLESAVNFALGFQIFSISIALICVVIISTRVAAFIILPITRLIKLIFKINKSSVNEGLPEDCKGSSDVSKVFDTLERLHTLVRMGNSQFFSGNLQSAYDTLLEALQLFTLLENGKAIGIVNNNLGNVAFFMYRTMTKMKLKKIVGLSIDDVIHQGVNYFECAIKQGEEALAKIYDEEGWSTIYLVFMQQLSNRYFNRALFLLTTKKSHPDPEKAESQGLADLSSARDMDREVIDNGDRHGFKGDRESYFDLLLERIRGIQHLSYLGYDSMWDVEELLEDAHRELNAALLEPGHAMFRHVEPAGQMQRLDQVLILHHLRKDESEMAALVAIRMLVEDDFILADAAQSALKGILFHFSNGFQNLIDPHDSDHVLSKLFEYRKKVAEAMNSETIKKRDVDSLIRSETMKHIKESGSIMELF
jgi:hypothetical protein